MTEIKNGYRTSSSWAPTFWERGLLRYMLLSYSLWMRTIYWDIRGLKPPRRGKPLDPRLTWLEKKWRWLSGEKKEAGR